MKTALEMLKEERAKLDAAIAALEGSTSPTRSVRAAQPPRTTGSTAAPMSSAQRAAISKRMKEAWAKRKRK